MIFYDVGLKVNWVLHYLSGLENVSTDELELFDRISIL